MSNIPADLKYTESQTVAAQRLVPLAPFAGMSEQTWARGMTAALRVLKAAHDAGARLQQCRPRCVDRSTPTALAARAAQLDGRALIERGTHDLDRGIAIGHGDVARRGQKRGSSGKRVCPACTCTRPSSAQR